MPGLVIPDAAEPYLLEILKDNKINNGDCTMRLFQNDITPDQLSVEPDFAEASFSNYAAIVSDIWFGPLIDGDDNAYLFSGVFSWSKIGATGNTIYGCYLTDGVQIIAAARFAAPVVMEADGTPLAFTATMTLRGVPVV